MLSLHNPFLDSLLSSLFLSGYIPWFPLCFISCFNNPLLFSECCAPCLESRVLDPRDWLSSDDQLTRVCKPAPRDTVSRDTHVIFPTNQRLWITCISSITCSPTRGLCSNDFASLVACTWLDWLKSRDPASWVLIGWHWLSSLPIGQLTSSNNRAQGK